jgi:hypothetical protein
MKNFLAIFTGTEAKRAAWDKLDDQERAKREKAGKQAWMDWATTHAASIVEQGSPLGKTKRAAADGVTDIKNNMAAYVVVKAETHEAAARIFEKHPHFTIFPGDGVEVMECLPMPEM